MRDGEDDTSGGGMAGNGGNGGHREGDERRHDLAEGIGHVAEAVACAGLGSCCSRPAEVEAVAEELVGAVACDGDEGGACGGLRFNLRESREEGGYEGGVETVLIVVAG